MSNESMTCFHIVYPGALSEAMYRAESAAFAHVSIVLSISIAWTSRRISSGERRRWYRSGSGQE
jgi:hypothetical protein